MVLSFSCKISRANQIGPPKQSSQENMTVHENDGLFQKSIALE